MKIAIMQPTYIPWLGYFNLIFNSDKFVFLDDVQFERKSWQQRNRIVNSDKLSWLTIPVLSSGQLSQKIIEVEIDNSQPWRKAHRKFILNSYGKSPYFSEISDLLEGCDAEFHSLCDFNISIMTKILMILDMECEFIKSSDLDVPGKRSDRLLALCRELGATSYLSPRGSRDYIEADGVFAGAGFPVEFQDYRPPVYRDTPPLHAGDFPSILDAIAYIGPSKTRDLVARAAS